MQKILLIEYHRNLSTGFIIEPKLCRQNDLLAFFVEKGKNSEDRKITKRNYIGSWTYSNWTGSKCLKNIKKAKKRALNTRNGWAIRNYIDHTLKNENDLNWNDSKSFFYDIYDSLNFLLLSRKCFILEIYIKKSKIKVYLQEKKETVKYFV